MNDQIPGLLDGDYTTYLSDDSVETEDDAERPNFTIEFLISINPSGMPQYRLRLKTFQLNKNDIFIALNLAATSYAFAAVPVTKEQPSAPEEHVPNYQQTPPEQRPKPPSFDTAPTTPTRDSRTGSEHQSAASTPVTENKAGGNRRDSKSSTSSQNVPPPQTLPEMVTPLVTPLTPLVASTLNAASSAISTARSVINRVLPNEQPQPSAPVPNETSSQQRPGYWLNGHWVSTNPNATREANLQALAEMGFWNRDLNATLLARYEDDLSRVVAELVH
nr:unnamed protein product [Callosobruchus analis]